jgi:hypothetical protein
VQTQVEKWKMMNIQGSYIIKHRILNGNQKQTVQVQNSDSKFRNQYQREFRMKIKKVK